MTRRIGLALALAFATALAGSSQVDEWRAQLNQGIAAETAGDYARAAAFYRDAVRISETFERGDPRRAFGLNSLGMMNDALGNFADAESAYRRALAALDESTHPSALDRAMVLANLSTLYTETGQPSRSKKLLDEALAIHAMADEPDEVRRAVVQNSLAELLIVTGRTEEANRLLTACLDVLGRHPDATTEIGISRNNLGVVRLYQGRFADATRLLEQSLATLEAAWGPEHPVVLRTLNNLAAAEQRNGQLAEAGKHWRHAIDLAGRRLGMEHPLYGEILSNYARYLRESGAKTEGKTLEARATRILRDNQRRNGVGALVDVSALQRKSR